MVQLARQLGGLKKLEWVDLGCHVPPLLNDEALELILRSRSIMTCYVDGSSISDRGLMTVSQHPSLKSISLYDNHGASDRAVDKLRRENPGITIAIRHAERAGDASATGGRVQTLEGAP